MSDSQVTIIGGLGRDPELRFTASGQAVVGFGVGVSHRYKARDAVEWTEETTWVDVTAWGALAENIASSAVKGSRVIVTGRFKTDTWTDKATGVERSKIALVADEVGLSLRFARGSMERNERTSSSGGGGGGSKPAGAPVYGDEEPF